MTDRIHRSKPLTSGIGIYAVKAGKPCLLSVQISIVTTSADTGANFTGGAGADVFNAQLGTVGSNATVVNSLQIFDSIDGAGGINTLNAVLSASVTPQALNNIQVINASATGNSTLNLTNAASVTTVTNLASAAELIVSNLAATATTLSVLDASPGADTTFAYASTTGTQTVGLTVDGLSTLAGNSPDTSAVTIAGIETINLATSGAASTFTLTADAATTVNITGAQNLTLAGTAVATAINASNFTGTLTTALTVAGVLD